MIKKKFLILSVFVIMVSMTGASVYPDVISSGGTVITADDNAYTLRFSLGQSTPISDPLTTGAAETETLKPGYIYTLDTRCVDEFDTEADGDVDGKDAAVFAAQLSGNALLAEKLSLLALSFGSSSCDQE